MDGFVTIRLPGIMGTQEKEAVAEVPAPAPAETVQPDEELLVRIATGDQDALALLFRRYAASVRRVACRVLRDFSEAEDMLQEVFLLIHRHASSFNPSKSPARFWILQIAYRSAISRRRYLDARHFYTRLDLDETDAHASSPFPARLSNPVDETLGVGVLEKMLRTLSENQQRTLSLFFVEGYRLDEIAAELGQTRENVRHHYFRGLEKLRKQIFHNNSGTK